MFKSSRVELIVAGCVLIVCVLSVLFVNNSFTHETDREPAPVEKTIGLGSRADYIQVEADVIGIDPIAERVTLSLSFIPYGRFDSGDGLLSVPIRVDVSDLSGTSLIFESGRRMFARELSFDLYEGEVQDYPFDRHHLLYEMLVLEQDASGEWVKTAAELDFIGAHHGYHFTYEGLPPSPNDYLGLDVTFSRSSLVIGTVIFCMAVIWGLTLVNLMLLWSVLAGRAEVDLGLFGYMSGFIVAIYFFRQIFPDIPSFLGVYADYLSFFWAELVTAGISIALAAVWFRKLVQQKNP